MPANSPQFKGHLTLVPEARFRFHRISTQQRSRPKLLSRTGRRIAPARRRCCLGRWLRGLRWSRLPWCPSRVGRWSSATRRPAGWSRFSWCRWRSRRWRSWSRLRPQSAPNYCRSSLRLPQRLRSEPGQLGASKLREWSSEAAGWRGQC